jgi:hypothetical protein
MVKGRDDVTRARLPTAAGQVEITNGKIKEEKNREQA